MAEKAARPRRRSRTSAASREKNVFFSFVSESDALLHVVRVVVGMYEDYDYDYVYDDEEDDDDPEHYPGFGRFSSN